MGFVINLLYRNSPLLTPAEKETVLETTQHQHSTPCCAADLPCSSWHLPSSAPLQDTPPQLSMTSLPVLDPTGSPTHHLPAWCWLWLACYACLKRLSCNFLKPFEDIREGQRQTSLAAQGHLSSATALVYQLWGQNTSEGVVPSSTPQADAYQATEILGSR